MDINKAFPSKYLKASDLGDSQPVVKVASVKPEPVGEGKELKPVVYFEGKTKGLVLNKTNAQTIAALSGSRSRRCLSSDHQRRGRTAKVCLRD